jgi:hypothetical protein
MNHISVELGKKATSLPIAGRVFNRAVNNNVEKTTVSCGMSR